MRSKTVIIKLLLKKMLTNILMNFLTESAVVKFILSMTFILKMYYLSFKTEKIAVKVLKHDFSCIRLLC